MIISHALASQRPRCCSPFFLLTSFPCQCQESSLHPCFGLLFVTLQRWPLASKARPASLKMCSIRVLTCIILVPSGSLLCGGDSTFTANCLFGGGSCTYTGGDGTLGSYSDLVNDSTLVLLALSAALALLLTIIVVCCYAKSCPCHGNCERGWKNY